MNQEDIRRAELPKTTTVARPWTNWVLICFLAIVGFFLFTEHRAHLFGALPYLLLLACPLLHFFHHGRHGGGGDHGSSPVQGDKP